MGNKQGLVFILANKLDITCGISSHLYYLLKEMGDYAKSTVVLISGGGNANHRYENLVFRMIQEPSVRHETRNYFSYARGIFIIRKLIKEYQPAVIHAHHFYAANIARHASIGIPVRLIQSVHALIPDAGKLPHFNADLYIAVNEHITAGIAGVVKNKNAVNLIRCGYKFNNSAIRKTEGPLKVIVASRLIRDKGIDTFIDAVCLLGNSSAEFEFTIAGAGADEQLFRKMAEDLPVIFQGESEGLYERLGEYDCLVNPTRSKMEGFPTIVIQAASKKLAVISTRFSGYESMLTDENSLLSEVDDSAGIADSLMRLSADNNLLRSKQELIFKQFREVFDITLTVSKIMEMYMPPVSEL